MRFYTDHRGHIIPMPRSKEPDLCWLGALVCCASAVIAILIIWGLVWLAIQAAAQ